MNSNRHSMEQFKKDLLALGVCEGDTIMMHSSFKALGGIEGGAEGIFCVLDELLGENGTLILPSFSYDTVNYNNPLFDVADTPCCVGYLPEYFRTKIPGVVRSVHATHSCAIKGRLAKELCADHELDLTPVGPNSPITKLPKYKGKILILGSHPDHNTALHGVEEKAEVPYLFNHDKPVHYILKNGSCEIEQYALRHYFNRGSYGYLQCYGRIIPLLSEDECRRGKVLDAECYLLSASAVWEKGCDMLSKDPFYFVERIDYKSK